MIRHATLKDLDQCVEICVIARDKSDNYSSFNVDVVRQNLLMRMLNPYSLVLVNSNMDGLLVAVASPSFYFDGYRTGNEFLFADSEGANFVRRYLRWAKNWPGEVEINFCTSFGGADGERAEALVQKMGLREIGKQYRVM